MRSCLSLRSERIKERWPASQASYATVALRILMPSNCSLWLRNAGQAVLLRSRLSSRLLGASSRMVQKPASLHPLDSPAAALLRCLHTSMTPFEVARAMVEALLIGFLVGAQREASLGERHPGMRDFLLISLVGALAGLLQQPWLTVAALLSITALLGVFHFQITERTGITTEMAAVATFCFGYMTTTPYAQLAIGMTLVVVAFLEAKQALHKLVSETITATEFNDTLRFLALIFVIYPLLPTGHFGPYQFFSPRQVWLFV